MEDWLGGFGLSPTVLFLVTILGHDFISSFCAVGTIQYFHLVAIFVLFHLEKQVWNTVRDLVESAWLNRPGPSSDRLKTLHVWIDDLVSRLQKRDPGLLALVFN